MIDLDKPDPFHPDEGYPHDGDDEDNCFVGKLLDTRGRAISTSLIRPDGSANFIIPFDTKVAAIQVKDATGKDIYAYGLTTQNVSAGCTFEVTLKTEFL